MTMLIEVDAGQSGEAHVFLTQDNNLNAKVPLRRSILQCNLQQKYRSTGKHNPQRDDGPEKGLYRLRPIALARNGAACRPIWCPGGGRRRSSSAGATWVSGNGFSNG